ncbi:hypothetical protein [Salinibaculum rarum]|uniref:hypothetical protein n=1 Tax=Salinibaculum rarum TaxID=3058903 RepID=UPI00265D8974|nr:hypothetical protein [Salinibaculum sp. KK48]
MTQQQQHRGTQDAQPTTTADLTLDTSTGLSTDDLISYISDIIADSPALFYNNAFIRLFTSNDELGFRVVHSPDDADAFINGRYYDSTFDEWRVRVNTPEKVQNGSYTHCTSFIKQTDIEHGHFMAFDWPGKHDNNSDYGNYDSCHGERGYWRADATPDNVAAIILSAFNHGHNVVADINLLATLLEAPIVTHGINDPTDASDASSDSTRSGHSKGGGITNVDGEYHCPAENCAYTGEFKEVRSHIGGKCNGNDDSHRHLDFRL